MSRLGKMPVAVPAGVTAALNAQKFTVRGPKGELFFDVPENIAVKIADGQVTLEPRETTKQARINWGLSRSMISNVLTGVSAGFTKKLEINGVGYKAAVQGDKLSLALGYSHEVNYPIPAGITVQTPKPTEIIISGIDRQRVGQVAAEIREYRGPEPYKGKGVKYSDERIFRKEGKKK
jgi:large subunit ribosomal protein L6